MLSGAWLIVSAVVLDSTYCSARVKLDEKNSDDITVWLQDESATNTALNYFSTAVNIGKNVTIEIDSFDSFDYLRNIGTTDFKILLFIDSFDYLIIRWASHKSLTVPVQYCTYVDYSNSDWFDSIRFDSIPIPFGY